ncbi:MAG: MbcA/ParS/Xre antitoxin family protein [Pseudoalteromonas distincta]
MKPESWYAFPDLLQQILALAIPVRGSKAKAFQWMNQPNSFLSDAAPIDLIETEEGAHKVLTYIESWIADQS